MGHTRAWNNLAKTGGEFVRSIGARAVREEGYGGSHYLVDVVLRPQVHKASTPPFFTFGRKVSRRLSANVQTCKL